MDTFLDDKVDAVGLDNGIDTMASQEAGSSDSSSSIVVPVNNPARPAAGKDCNSPYSRYILRIYRNTLSSFVSYWHV